MGRGRVCGAVAPHRFGGGWRLRRLVLSEFGAHHLVFWHSLTIKLRMEAAAPSMAESTHSVVLVSACLRFAFRQDGESSSTGPMMRGPHPHRRTRCRLRREPLRPMQLAELDARFALHRRCRVAEPHGAIAQRRSCSRRRAKGPHSMCLLHRLPW